MVGVFDVLDDGGLKLNVFLFRRSYIEGVKLGFLTQDPSQYHNANVCEPYLTTS